MSAFQKDAPQQNLRSRLENRLFPQVTFSHSQPGSQIPVNLVLAQSIHYQNASSDAQLLGAIIRSSIAVEAEMIRAPGDRQGVVQVHRSEGVGNYTFTEPSISIREDAGEA